MATKKKKISNKIYDAAIKKWNEEFAKRGYAIVSADYGVKLLNKIIQ